MKTVHVYRSEKGWAVKRDNTKASNLFATQQEAVQNARLIAKKAAPSQMVVIASDGRIRDYAAFGRPWVQDPPAKSAHTRQIQRAVGKLALERLADDPNPPRA